MAFKLLIGGTHKLNVGNSFNLLIEGIATTSLRRWNGTDWVASPSMSYYNGTDFINKPLKRWNGTTWETVNVV